MVPERLEREILIEAPLEVVWSVITEPEHISGWFGDTAEVELRPGGSLIFRWEERDHAIHGRVERVEPPRFFSYRWFRDSDLDEANSTLVEFSLEADGNSTRLTVVETGFQHLAGTDEERQADADDHREGWKEELDELREYARVSAKR
jgi:uncharacterized protein YndB with AHSA1/START domain